MIETERLLLRRWRDEDREPFARLNAEPQVADWLGGAIDRTQSDGYIDRAETCFEASGYGRFAVARRADGLLIGSVGLAPVHPGLPLTGVEIGWRLAPDAWGRGYASEAALAVVADAFTRLALDEIVSFTAQINERSQAVMRRAGFRRDPGRDFDNPVLAEGHRLRRHVVYARGRPA